MTATLAPPRPSEWLPVTRTTTPHGRVLLIGGVPIYVRGGDGLAFTEAQYADIVDPPHDALVGRLVAAAQEAG